MPRVKLTEHRAKTILLGSAYKGATQDTAATLPEGKYVVKVDQGIKKRMKRGLVALNETPGSFTKHFAEWGTQGYTNFIIEPMLAHEGSEERYISFERVREGLRVLYAAEGGIEIEEHPERVQKYELKSSADITAIVAATGIPASFFESVLKAFDENYFAFLEINPLVVKNGEAHLLDAAALVDSAAQFFAKGWGAGDIVKAIAKHPAEVAVETLAATTPASLKLNVINPNGSLFFLLSGGGGSIVIADEAELRGMGQEIGNYGEYSGGPTREETYLYTKEVLSVVLGSTAKKKALVIAGGVANFTDVKATFGGIIDALAEVSAQLQKAGVKIFIRRGGPNEAAGLALMRAFLEKENMLGAIHGSDAVITSAVDDAIDYLKS